MADCAEKLTRHSYHLQLTLTAIATSDSLLPWLAWAVLGTLSAAVSQKVIVSFDSEFEEPGSHVRRVLPLQV